MAEGRGNRALAVLLLFIATASPALAGSPTPLPDAAERLVPASNAAAPPAPSLPSAKLPSGRDATAATDAARGLDVLGALAGGLGAVVGGLGTLAGGLAGAGAALLGGLAWLLGALASALLALGGALGTVGLALARALAWALGALASALLALAGALAALLVASAAAVQRDPRLLAPVAGAAALGGLAWWARAGGLAPLMGLFSRLQQHELLDSATRRRIYEFVRDRPGAHVSQVSQAVGLGWGATVYHLQRLRDARLLSARPVGNQLCHFISGDQHSPAEQQLLAAAKTPKAQAIVDYIKLRGPSSQHSIAAELGMSSALVSWHAKRLEDLGVLDRARSGRTCTLTLRAGAPVPPPAPVAVAAA